LTQSNKGAFLLPESEAFCLLPLLRSLVLVLIVFSPGFSSQILAQVSPDLPLYTRLNTFSVFGAYSWDSSHMFLGYAQNRQLINIGVAYSRRLMLGRAVNWQYNAEVMPVALESDPVVHSVISQQTPTAETFVTDYRQWGACIPMSESYSTTDPSGVVFSGAVTLKCDRTWTIGTAMSPIGFQWNFWPRHKVQPIIIGHGGYMYSTQPIPVDYAGAFNFTFDIGAGVEIYQSQTRSLRADFRYHHISNDDTAGYNPGIDSGLLQVTYSFGR
jgi:Lipid A 3-O-deacylase (PagL)